MIGRSGSGAGRQGSGEAGGQGVGLQDGQGAVAVLFCRGESCLRVLQLVHAGAHCIIGCMCGAGHGVECVNACRPWVCDRPMH